VVIALFACLLIGIGLIDRPALQPSQHYQSHTYSAEKTGQEALIVPREHFIFGWPAIDVFTGFLVVATFLLAFIAIRQNRHNRLIERAYVAGGGPYDGTNRRFVLHINNFGRTQAEIISFQVGFCEFAAIPEAPNYTIDRDFRDFLPPGRFNYTLAFIGVDPALNDPVIFGRFHYRDIFGSTRSSGFILRIDRANGRTTPINAPPAYTAETEES
jgi:hypothetical protein